MSKKIVTESKEIERIREQLNKSMPFTISGWPYDTEEIRRLPQGPQFFYEDKELNESYNCAVLLEFFKTQIATFNEYTLAEVLYSWYFWFTKFLAHYESLYGRDESMRQQQFKIIEALDYAVAENGGTIDCDLLENMEKQFGYSSID